MRRGAVFAFVLAALASHEAGAAEPSASDSAAAEQLFLEARELAKTGQHRAACPKFAESMRLDPAIGTQLNLGDCYEQLGKTASAWICFHDAEIAARRAGQENRVKVASERARALEPRLSRIAIEVRGAVAELAGLAITRDAQPVAAAQWSSEVPVDPGAHLITASARGKTPWEKWLDVREEGAVYRVTIPALRDAPRASARAGTGQRALGFVVGGLGLGGLALGAALGALALDHNADSKNFCLPESPNRCASEGIALRDSAIAYGNGSTAALALGAALVVSGVIVVVTAPRSSKEARAEVGLALAATNAMVQGRW
jgi:hypothetical protein